MSKTLIALRHVQFEDLGTFAPVFAAAGYAIQYRDVGVDDLGGLHAAEIDMLTVLGGPIGAYEDDKYPFLADEIALIERRLAAGRPTLGVCLGAQLMARALGKRVYPGPAKEIGWAPVELSDAGRAGPLRHLDGVAVLHWHGDTFDLPDEAQRLASTPLCRNQAFAIGASTLALQFHPEVEQETFERWLIGHASEIAQAGLAPQALRAGTQIHASAADRHGRACLNAWLHGLQG